MKKYWWIILSLVIMGCISLLISNKNEEEKNKAYSNKDCENKLNDINKQIVLGMSKEDYKKITGKDFIPQYILIGEDSFLKESISFNLKKKDNFSSYEEKMYEYANNVEKKIQENFESKITEVLKSGEGNTIIKLTYKPYYYCLYLHDLETIISKLLDYKGYKKDIPDEDAEKGEIDYYKAKIKAMEIIDNYLDDYKNNYEYFDQDIIFRGNDLNAPNAYIESYLLTISGNLSKNIDLGDENYLSKRDKIVESYINNAVQNGTLDKSDPLKLK